MFKCFDAVSSYQATKSHIYGKIISNNLLIKIRKKMNIIATRQSAFCRSRASRFETAFRFSAGNRRRAEILGCAERLVAQSGR